MLISLRRRIFFVQTLYLRKRTEHTPIGLHCSLLQKSSLIFPLHFVILPRNVEEFRLKLEVVMVKVDLHNTDYAALDVDVASPVQSDRKRLCQECAIKEETRQQSTTLLSSALKTHQEVIDNTAFFMLVSIRTMRTLFSNVARTLALESDWQDRLRHAETQEQPIASKLRRAVIKETIRIFPFAPI